MSERERPHTFVVYVENRPGVLNRVASLFRRRAYNIESLTVGHTERPGVSRMTIVSSIGDSGAHRVEANLYKLVNVLSAEDVTFAPTISRSLALIKVQAREDSRRQLMDIVRVFRARVVDLAPQSLIIEITGAEDKVNALVDVLRPFGIIEMVRTGQTAMARGSQAGKEEPSPAVAAEAAPESPQESPAARAGSPEPAAKALASALDSHSV